MKHRLFYAPSTLCAVVLWLTVPVAGQAPNARAAANKATAQKTQDNAPVLFVEFRKEGRSIDPDPWWSDGARKVQG